MLKKIDRAKLFLQREAARFRCPHCHECMKTSESGLVCQNGHRYDVSKKGTMHFLMRPIVSDYDQQLFEARGRMIRCGMYQPLLTYLTQKLDQTAVLDIGCGEGSFLSLLTQQADIQVGIGFDIAKEGVNLATNQASDTFWCTADLTNLPFADHSFTTLLNIFSPSNYQEFDRVLQTGGQLIKVVPGADYLKELRRAFYPEDQKKQQYSNERVVEKFSEAFQTYEKQQLTYIFEIPKAQQLDLLEMSPLEWGASSERKKALMNQPLTRITVDLEILIGKKSK
ncbi:methyltransferase domain-containing protein [Enterococcus bulliens]